MKNVELSGDEKAMVKDMLEIIIEDADLRRGFRQVCDARVPAMRKICAKLSKQIISEPMRVALP